MPKKPAVHILKPFLVLEMTYMTSCCRREQYVSHEILHIKTQLDYCKSSMASVTISVSFAVIRFLFPLVVT